MKIKVPCDCCKGGTKPLTYPEGGHCVCPYCKDTGEREETVPDPTHSMSEWSSTILAPTGEPRFYSVRSCNNCGEEEWRAAAGHFLHNLTRPCAEAKS